MDRRIWRKPTVRGLTTAASIWVTAAIGACAGAGLPVLAAATTAIYLIVAVIYPVITRRLPRSSTAISIMRVRYPDGRGTLRRLLQVATDLGFAIDQLSTESLGHAGLEGSEVDHDGGTRHEVEVTMHVHGRASVNHLVAALSEIEEVEAVVAGDANEVDD